MASGTRNGNTSASASPVTSHTIAWPARTSTTGWRTICQTRHATIAVAISASDASCPSETSDWIKGISAVNWRHANRNR